jgi:nitrate reductase NapE component
VDLSAFIFVALAVAWAVYLVPKALRHHDDVVRSRSVERFSHTMRVLARREPVAARRSRGEARLVVTPGRGRSVPEVTTKPSAAAEAAEVPVAEPARPATPLASPAARREAAALAARRRRRVLGLLLVVLVAVAVVAAFGVISWWWTAVPTALLVAWLVACRLMVRSEHAARPRAIVPSGPSREGDAPAEDAPDEDAFAEAHTSSTPAITDEGLWDPMPVTLPTYVSKPAATRTVRTIDLESTGVWTSGRTESDAALAREADEAGRAERARRQDDDGRAVGS